jgi:hypothetical protein
MMKFGAFGKNCRQDHPEKAKNGGRNVSSWWEIDRKTICSKDKAKTKQEMP